MMFPGRHPQEGAAAVEFAIILPILIILVFGIIEFSVILFDKAMITNASREGARAGIVYRYDPVNEVEDPLDTTEIQNVVNNYCQNHLISFGGPGNLQVNVAWENQPVTNDPELRVTATYKYNFLVLPNFITTLTGDIDLAATTVMRME